MIRFTDNDFEFLKDYVGREFGIDLTKKRVLAECRMSNELESRGISSMGEFIDLLSKDMTGSLKSALVNRLTTNYTFFMREPRHFEFLEQQILPALDAQESSLYRIWCAGCASGEECYTLAMILRHYTETRGRLPDFEIIGTDISQKVLNQAQRGIYPMRELEKIPPLWQKQYCRPVSDDSFMIQEELKEKVKFFRANLMKAGSLFGQYDLILCRNVMIYFGEAARKKLLRNLYQALKPGGYLFVGHTELLPSNCELFTYVCPAVYKK